MTRDRNEIVAALREMRTEVLAVKKEAEGYGGDLDAMKPEELTLPMAGPSDEGPERPGEPGEPGEEGPEKGEKKEEIKTPEDAKKVLEEATKDIQNVVDNLDGISGQTEEEEKTATVKRFNDRYASNLTTLAQKADEAIRDARAAMKHWSFLRKAHQPKVEITDPGLRQAAQTLEQMGMFEKALKRLGFVR